MMLYFWLILLSTSAWATDYAVMIDAGSTGSRVFIYELGTTVTLKNKFKIEPGLSNFKHNTKGLKAYFEPMIDFTKRELGETVHMDKVSLTLQATGGLRRLSPLSQKRLMRATKIVLSDFGFKNPRVEVISGKKEGIYEWMTINYLLGSLGKADKPSAGLVEFGGASFQVTFMQGPRLYSRTYDNMGDNVLAEKAFAKPCLSIPLEYSVCRQSLERHLKVLPKPKLQGEFQIVDNFEELDMLFHFKKISPIILDEVGPALCRRTFESLKEELPTRKDLYVSRLCYQTAYMSVILEKLGFKRNQELSAGKEIADTALTWTLGSLLDSLSSQKVPVVQ